MNRFACVTLTLLWLAIGYAFAVSAQTDKPAPNAQKVLMKIPV